MVDFELGDQAGVLIVLSLGLLSDDALYDELAHQSCGVILAANPTEMLYDLLCFQRG